jgi:hypothetical protein
MTFHIPNFIINPLGPLSLTYKNWEVLLNPVENVINLFQMINIHSSTNHKGKKYWCVTPEPLPTAICAIFKKSGEGIKRNRDAASV